MDEQAKAANEESEPEQRVVVTLHPQSVANAILASVADVLTVMGICVPAIEGADLTKRKEAGAAAERVAAVPAGGRIPVSFDLHDTRTPEDRKAACINWMLSRGFQELARGVRNALERAYLYLAVLESVGGEENKKWGDFQSAVATSQKQAQSLNFPDLLEAVNKRLSKPLHFEKEFLSFQKIRNCLEHRAGVVGQIDADANGRLVLALPRPLIFYMKGGKEIEVRQGELIEGDDGGGAQIHLRMGTGTREFKLGERVQFSADEFEEIGLGCWAFANDLSNKLPRPELKGPPQGKGC